MEKWPNPLKSLLPNSLFSSDPVALTGFLAKVYAAGSVSERRFPASHSIPVNGTGFDRPLTGSGHAILRESSMHIQQTAVFIVVYKISRRLR